MFGIIIAFFLWGALSYITLEDFKRNQTLDPVILNRLFGFHFIVTVGYYLYAINNPSDSYYYYIKVVNNFRGPDWFDAYGVSTTFIEFIGYPFIKFLGFGYEGIMLLFSYFGFLGFCYFYVFLRENIRFRHTFLGFNLVTLILFLPNSHFWTSSFGKGPVIFLGLSAYFFGITQLRTRYLAVIIGSLLVYHVRPHIFFVLLIASLGGFMFSTKGVAWPVRLAFLVVAGFTLAYIYKDILLLVGLDEDTFVQASNLSHRASELTKASSGIDIQDYNLAEQMFSFLYRPLFFDAVGPLGLFASFENLFYLIITLRLLTFRGIGFLIRSNFLVKTAFISFLLVSYALAQVSGNLGIAMRQKTQVMSFFMFVVVAYLDSQTMVRYRSYWYQSWRRYLSRITNRPLVNE